MTHSFPTRRASGVVDISHASDNCVRDVLALSKAPVIGSHSSARAVVDVPRNLPDDLLRAIGDKGGVVQAVAYYQFVKDDPARVAAEDADRKSTRLNSSHSCAPRQTSSA